MLTEIEHIMQVVAEEACEIGQAAMKCTRFAMDGNYPDGRGNIEVLIAEVNDLLGTLEMLVERGINLDGIGNTIAKTNKKLKVLAMMRLARERGTLEPEGEPDVEMGCFDLSKLVTQLANQGKNILVVFNLVSLMDEFGNLLMSEKNPTDGVYCFSTRFNRGERGVALRDSKVLLATLQTIREGCMLERFDHLFFFDISPTNKSRIYMQKNWESQRGLAEFRKAQYRERSSYGKP